MRIRALKLYDVHFGNQWFDRVLDRWNYGDFKADASWRKGWISFDCCLYNSSDERVYLGLTSFDADIFKAYDRASDAFVDLGYHQIADPFDAKFHRSLQRGADGCLYAAIALLHDVDRLHDAPGGAVIRYDPRSHELRKLAIPLPHVYIQATVPDPTHEALYCLCFPPEKLASFNLRTAEVRDYGLIGTGIGGMTQAENLVLDDQGCVWSNWQVTRAWQTQPGADAARLCKLDPAQERLVFFDCGLPRPAGAYGTVKAEAFFNFHDGWLYASGANGSLFRIDPETAAARYLFTPIADRPSRLAALVLGPDGCAYGVTGREGRCELLRFDFRHDRYELLGPIVDDRGEACWQVHDICVTDDGTFYACENDNPHRSGYLWEIYPER